MKSGSWACFQSALPIEARAGGEPDDDPEPEPVVLAPCQVCGTPCPDDMETCGSQACRDALDAWRREMANQPESDQ